MKTVTVINGYGDELDYEAAMQFAYNADQDICEELNMIGA